VKSSPPCWRKAGYNILKAQNAAAFNAWPTFACSV
jgi:hypothetical protein